MIDYSVLLGVSHNFVIFTNVQTVHGEGERE